MMWRRGEGQNKDKKDEEEREVRIWTVRRGGRGRVSEKKDEKRRIKRKRRR